MTAGAAAAIVTCLLTVLILTFMVCGPACSMRQTTAEAEAPWRTTLHQAALRAQLQPLLQAQQQQLQGQLREQQQQLQLQLSKQQQQQAQQQKQQQEQLQQQLEQQLERQQQQKQDAPAPAPATSDANVGDMAGLNYLLDHVAGSVHLSHEQRLLFDRARLGHFLDSSAFDDQLAQQRRDAEGRSASSTWRRRGILMVAGGRDMTANALVGVRILREQLGCTLPIEVGAPAPAQLAARGSAECRVLSAESWPQLQAGGAITSSANHVP
jgi:hypothetical protein